MSAVAAVRGGRHEPVLRPVTQPEPRPILTRAETAECTCPEACERDHEQD